MYEVIWLESAVNDLRVSGHAPIRPDAEPSPRPPMPSIGRWDRTRSVRANPGQARSESCSSTLWVLSSRSIARGGSCGSGTFGDID